MKSLIEHILLTGSICNVHKEFINKIVERQLVLTEVLFRVLFIPISEYFKNDSISIPIICCIMSYLIENENNHYSPYEVYNLLDIKDDTLLSILMKYTPNRCRIQKVFLTFSPERTRSSYDLTKDYHVCVFRHLFYYQKKLLCL
jgi:hypothetical protein